MGISEKLKCKGYKVIHNGNGCSIFHKKYSHYINQIITIVHSNKKALVEFSIADIYIDDIVIKELQYALETTKKDLQECLEN